MKNRAFHLFFFLLTALFWAQSTPVQGAIPQVSGTYVTPTKSGTIKFKAQRAFRAGSWGIAYIGNYNISGKNYPGSFFANGAKGTTLSWNYNSINYEQAGQALVFQQPDGSWLGTISFYDKAGNTISTGTAKITVK